MGDLGGGGAKLVDGAIAFAGGFQAELGDDVGDAFGGAASGDSGVEELGSGLIGGKDAGVVVAQVVVIDEVPPPVPSVFAPISPTSDAFQTLSGRSEPNSWVTASYG